MVDGVRGDESSSASKRSILSKQMQLRPPATAPMMRALAEPLSRELVSGRRVNTRIKKRLCTNQGPGPLEITTLPPRPRDQTRL
jgi:hypothetical protein